MDKRVLVVGTTPDYVDIIRKGHPGRALFLTHRDLRTHAWETPPEEGEEVLSDLADPRAVIMDLKGHLGTHSQSIRGIACYDDESLGLASVLAHKLGLPFHSEKAIHISRNKFHCKRAWIGAGVFCPRVQTARDEDGLEAVMDRLGLPLVLKPLTGAGSELVFWCARREEARRAFKIISRFLAEHPDVRMYPPGPIPGTGFDPRQDIVAEEGFSGPEFSCDFLVEGGKVRLIRVAGKVLAPRLGTGTALIYYLPAHNDTGIDMTDLKKQLLDAAQALGFGEGLFMADFIAHRGRACFLEVSSRPAGDCLPWLIRAGSGLDILGLALDVAEGKKVRLPGPEAFKPLAAVRIFADTQGILKRIDIRQLEEDPRVREVTLYRRPGHRVTLPPRDYGSRILGHALFRPTDMSRLAEEGAELGGLARVEMEP